MSFSFDFCMDEEYDEPVVAASTSARRETHENECKFPAHELLISNLLSYSPVAVNDGGVPVVLARRDLFDVRFQILNDEGTFADEQSDLIPGVYEGGLKTWECSLDLVAELHARVSYVRQHDAAWPSGRHITEFGCGTALPSCYMLQTLFSVAPRPEHPTVLSVCDYNEQVVYPNLLLAWYFSEAGPAAAQGHRQQEPGDLEIDESLLDQFKEALSRFGIQLRFFAGGWDSLELGKPADILLSSETTYSLETIPSLCRALQAASWPTKENGQEGIETHTSMCLIASKVLYFGVGGGIEPFRSEVLAHRGWCKQVRSFTAGVGRGVLQIGWSS